MIALVTIRRHVGGLGALVALCYARHHAYRSVRPNREIIDDMLRGLAWRLTNGSP